MMNSTPESSSGVVSDDHYLTISDHSESFTSPRRAFNHRHPNSSEQFRTSRTSSSTPSPVAHRSNVISHHPSPTSPSQTINTGIKESPVYQNLPARITSHKKHSNTTISPEKKNSENRLKKQIKSIFQVQNKFSFAQPSSRNHPKHLKKQSPSNVKVHRTAGQARLNDFDDGLLTRIFQRLPSNELCKCAMVCKKWYELVWNPCLWSHIVIDNQALDVDRGIKCLTTALSYDELKVCLIIESIDLTGCHRLTDRGLYLIAARCPRLKELILDGCREVTNIAIFEIVSRCIDLESLSLSGESKEVVLTRRFYSLHLLIITNNCMDFRKVLVVWLLKLYCNVCILQKPYVVAYVTVYVIYTCICNYGPTQHGSMFSI